jgi:hypothetical protein
MVLVYMHQEHCFIVYSTVIDSRGHLGSCCGLATDTQLGTAVDGLQPAGYRTANRGWSTFTLSKGASNQGMETNACCTHGQVFTYCAPW